MILWTIQDRRPYEKMLDCGVLRSDEKYILFEEFRESYLWMADQMVKRIGMPPKGVRFPVWAWYRWEGERKRPDMRSHGRYYGEKGMPIVLLTIDVPEKYVLLSDFDYWHFVLNDIPYLFSDDGEIQDCSPEEKVSSWENIFDINHIQEGDEEMPLSTQATLWEIRKEWVIKAEFFVSR